MKSYLSLVISFIIAVASIWIGFAMRHSPSDFIVGGGSGANGSIQIMDFSRLGVYRELGLGLAIFGLGLLLMVFYFWIKDELTP